MKRVARHVEIVAGRTIRVPGTATRKDPKVAKGVQLLRKLAREAPFHMQSHAKLLHKDDSGKPLKPAAHHKVWIDILEDIEKYRWVVIVAPPGYAKSTWCSVAYASWRIGATGGKSRIGVISNTATQAQGFASSVRSSIESGWWKEAYPKIRPDYKRGWSKDMFWVSSAVDSANPTLMAVGMGGPIQGKRFDEIILDDPTTYAEARSKIIMEHQKSFVRNTVLTRFPAGQGPPDGQGRMVVACTRWGENDLVPLLQDDYGFKVIRMPALGYWDRSIDPETGETIYGEAPLWEEKQGYDSLKESQQNDGITFELVMQGNPRAMSGDLFNPPFNYGVPPRDETVGFKNPDDLPPDVLLARQIRATMEQVVQFVDTASGQDRLKGDFFAMATVGVRNSGTEVWILDIDRDRYSVPEQERRIVHNAEKWQPDSVVVENANEGIAIFQRLVQTERLPLQKFKPTQDKETRAVPLANAYRANIVYHPATLVNDKFVTPKWVKQYEEELKAFPKGLNDDQVDAVGGAYSATARPGPRMRQLG